MDHLDSVRRMCDPKQINDVLHSPSSQYISAYAVGFFGATVDIFFNP